jgi:hypothetical protein
MRRVPEIVVEFSDENDKILNPHQRQLLEDTKRTKEKLAMMQREGEVEDILEKLLVFIDVLCSDFGSASHLVMRKQEESFDPDEMDERDR